MARGDIVQTNYKIYTPMALPTHGSFVMDQAPTPGNTLYVIMSFRQRTHTTALDGFTNFTGRVYAPLDGHQDFSVEASHRIVQLGDSATVTGADFGTSSGERAVIYWEVEGSFAAPTTHGTDWEDESIGPLGSSPQNGLSLGTLVAP